MPPKWCYVVMGIDIAFAVLCAVLHQPQAFFFLGLAIFMNYIGDSRQNEKDKGE